MLGIALVEFVLNPFFVELATAVPVTLPSGIVLDLSRQQVDAIREEPGVFYGADAADMLVPGEVVVAVPSELGGGYIYGRPEHLSRAFAASGVTRGTTTATQLFVKRGSCLWF
jgi:hypothetical protein